eukprot:423719_1
MSSNGNPGRICVHPTIPITMSAKNITIITTRVYVFVSQSNNGSNNESSIDAGFSLVGFCACVQSAQQHRNDQSLNSFFILRATKVKIAVKPNMMAMKFNNTISAPKEAKRATSGKTIVLPITNPKKLAKEVNATEDPAIRTVSPIISGTDNASRYLNAKSKINISSTPNPNAMNGKTCTMFGDKGICKKEPKPIVATTENKTNNTPAKEASDRDKNQLEKLIALKQANAIMITYASTNKPKSAADASRNKSPVVRGVQ